MNTWPPQVCTRHCWCCQKGALFLHKCPADAEPRLKTSPLGMKTTRIFVLPVRQGIHLGSYISCTQARLRPLRTGSGHPCGQPLVIISMNYSSFISNASQSNQALQQVTTVAFFKGFMDHTLHSMFDFCCFFPFFKNKDVALRGAAL